MGFGRVMLWFTLIVGGLGFLVMVGQLDQTMQIVYAAALLLLMAVLLRPGRGKKVVRRRRRSELAAEEEAAVDDLPAPVVGEDDTSSRRSDKISRSRGRGADVEDEPEEEAVVSVALADEEVAVEAIEDKVHVAEEYVAEVDADSMEEADIEAFIDERREHHARVRRRIEARRREDLAQIRADSARMYQSADEGEDLVALLSTPGHGLTVIEEDASETDGHPVGATFVRIDETRVMKVRIPLDTGYVAPKDPTAEPELPALPPLPMPAADGSLPPLPMPLPSQNALADLAAEMDKS